MVWDVFRIVRSRPFVRHKAPRPRKVRPALELLEDRLAPAAVNFAIIGDYGLAGQPELDVSNLVKSWNPELIITLGDNNYGSSTFPTGSAETIDANIGQYYHDYIYPYYGSYGAGSPTNTNRFFPTLGDQDWNDTAGFQPHLDYFTLPGNERYYTFTQGPVQFFALDSDPHEPDGIRADTVQGQWLQSQLAASTATWKVVYFQNPPYSSHGGSTSATRWPFEAWGATAVFSGNAHIYERLVKDTNFPYFINGLGGAGCCHSSFSTPLAGSQVRYNADRAAMHVEATDDHITFQEVSRTGTIVDTYTIFAVPEAHLPAAPTGLTATAVSSDRIDLAWTDNSSNETGFVIERGLDGTTFSALDTVGPNVLSYSDLNVVPETHYFYRVRAANSQGDSNPSNVSTATPTLLPSPPSGLTGIAVASTEIDLAWTDNSNDELGFEIERSTDGGATFTEIATVGANTTVYHDTGLTADTLYYYRVEAVGTFGDSPYSNTISAVTSVPEEPENLTATVSSATRINLAWVSEDSSVTGFFIERSTDGTNFTQIATAAASATSYSNGSLTAGVTYYYRLRATNGLGLSPYTNVATATTAPPVAPGGLAATAVSNTQVNLSWVDHSVDETGFKVYRSTNGTSWTKVATLGFNITSYSDTGRTANVLYYYQVKAYNGVDNSDPSNTVTAQTYALATPGSLTATAVSITQINLAWTDNSTTETGFKIERSTDGVTFTQIATVGANVTAYNNSGLTPGTTYSYRVRATKTSGDSAYSNVAGDLTAPPATPTGLTATAVSTSEIDLVWTDNSSNEAGFTLERSADGTSFTPLTTLAANVTFFSDTGLTPDTQYFYRLKATDTVGDSAYSNVADNITAVPATPDGLTATAVSTSAINLAWTDNSSNETGFILEKSTDGTTFTEVATLGANVTTYSDTGLLPGTQYFYQVRAINVLGSSGRSNVSSDTTFSVVNAPSDLAAVVASTSEIDLTWVDNSGNEIGFALERSTDNMTFVEVATTAADAASYSDTGLELNAQYYYRILAFTAQNSSGYSNVAGSLTGSPNAPSALAATAVSTSAIDLAWTDNSSNEAGFALERSTDGGNTFSPLASVGPNVTTYSDAGLAPGQYYYQVKAQNAVSDSDYTPAASAATLTVPTAPAGLTAQAVSGTEIDLAWTDLSDNESGFTVEGSADGTTFTPIGTVGANVTTFANTGLTPGTLYYYQVRATNGAGASDPSNPASATALALPAAPSGLSAAAVTTAQINLAWTDNSDNETGFVIARSTDGTTYAPVGTAGPDATTYNDTGLAANTRYYYQVKATNAGGDSGYTNVASDLTAIPAAPGGLTATAVSVTQINLAWTDNASNETGFVIQRGTDGVSFSQVGTAGVNATTYNDTGLTAGIRYYYQVLATNAVGTSAPSNAASDLTAVPAAPSGLTATTVSSTQINLAWTDNASNETGFTLERSTDGTSFTPIATLAANATAFNNTGLTTNQPYWYRVKANGTVGASAYSNVASASTGTPAAPTALTATAASYTQINLAWTDNSSNETGFKIERSLDNSSWSAVATVAANVTTYNHTGRSANTLYYYRVKATNAIGDSAYSNVASAVTSPPAVPTGLTATAVSTSQINLAWTDNSSNETGFKIERSTNGTSWSQVATVAANVTTYSDTGRTANTLYYYRVRATNAVGDSAYSNTASSLTAAPAAPSGLTATAVSTSQINLAWTDNASNETGFTLERSTDGTSFTPIATLAANATAYSNTGLTTGTRYYYRVLASNAVGTSAYSNVASDLTAVPAAPSGLTATAVSGTQINLAWADNASNETGFTLERSTDGTSFTTIATLAANATAFNNTGLTTNQPYWYRVKANGTVGASAYSNVASATPVTLAAPTALTATAASYTQVNLAWTDNASNETGFKVERSTNGTSWSQVATVAANVTTYSDTGRTANTLYYYRVRATNAGGDSAYSNTASAVTSPPAVPTNLTATAVSNSQINLTWTDAGTTETGFKVYRSTDNVSWTLVTTVGANVTTFSDTGRASGKLIYYKVKSTNAVADSAYSNLASATTYALATPGNLTATAVSSSQINLSWVDTTSTEQGFKIEYSLDGTSWTQLATVGANVTTFSHTGLTAGTRYYYRVKAYNAGGESAYAGPASAIP